MGGEINTVSRGEIGTVDPPNDYWIHAHGHARSFFSRNNPPMVPKLGTCVDILRIGMSCKEEIYNDLILFIFIDKAQRINHSIFPFTSDLLSLSWEGRFFFF